MNEIEREFYADMRQKKTIAHSARTRKCGVKSKKCSLPSDHLTAAQKRKLNGPVQTFNINKPMSWEAFKALPDDLQQNHLDYIQNTFSASMTAIERDVFHIGNCTLRQHCEKRGLHWLNVGTRSCDSRALKQWASGEPIEVTVEPEPEVEIEPEVPKPTAGPSFSDLRGLPEVLGNGKICMSGKADEIIPKLLLLIGTNDAWLSVHLNFTRKDD